MVAKAICRHKCLRGNMAAANAKPAPVPAEHQAEVDKLTQAYANAAQVAEDERTRAYKMLKVFKGTPRSKQNALESIEKVYNQAIKDAWQAYEAELAKLDITVAPPLKTSK